MLLWIEIACKITLHTAVYAGDIFAVLALWMMMSIVSLLCAFNQTQSRCWGLRLNRQCVDSQQCTESACIQHNWQLILAGKQCVSKPNFISNSVFTWCFAAMLPCLKKKKKKKGFFSKIVIPFSDHVRSVGLYASYVGPHACHTCHRGGSLICAHLSHSHILSVFRVWWLTNQPMEHVRAAITLCVRCSV